MMLNEPGLNGVAVEIDARPQSGSDDGAQRAVRGNCNAKTRLFKNELRRGIGSYAVFCCFPQQL